MCGWLKELRFGADVTELSLRYGCRTFGGGLCGHTTVASWVAPRARFDCCCSLHFVHAVHGGVAWELRCKRGVAWLSVPCGCYTFGGGLGGHTSVASWVAPRARLDYYCSLSSVRAMLARAAWVGIGQRRVSVGFCAVITEIVCGLCRVVQFAG